MAVQKMHKKAESFDRRSQHHFLLGQLHRLSENDMSAECPRWRLDLKNSDGQTSSKNRSLNRDVECRSVETIFAQ
jgi:hypothetical protein